MVEAKYGGSECSGSYTDTGLCNTNNCPGTYETYTLYQTKLLTILWLWLWDNTTRKKLWLCGPHDHTKTRVVLKPTTIYVILISQLIANGVHGALGTVVRKAVDGELKQDTDTNLFMLNMVEMNAMAVLVRHNHVK